ncbi:MAG: (Fe-S)-binding protein [Crenarchaeota archaeon]|nr:(Fe-S)-binding protein [Thermoproteota archaeon]
MMRAESKNLDKAFWRLSKYIESNTIHYVENCISCGICYEICPAYHLDHRYAPAPIGEWFRRFYRRQLNPIARVLGKLAHAYPLTVENLMKAREYVYRCTNCGACYMVCAAGIDSGHLALLTKSLINDAGLTPQILKTLNEMELRMTYLTSKVQDLYGKLVEEIKKIAGGEAHINEPDRSVYIPISVCDLVFAKDVIVSTIRILERLGITWTIPDAPVGIRPPMGYVIGDFTSYAALIRRIYINAKELNCRIILVTDCGYMYPALRFEGPYIAEMEQPCKVLSIVELLEDYAERGLLFLRKIADVATWHDPCMLMRRGGVEYPHAILEESTFFSKLKWSGKYSRCCGGGSHMFFLQEEVAKALSDVLEVDLVKMLEKDTFAKRIAEFGYEMARHRAQEIIDNGPKIVITACTSCIFMLRKAISESTMPFIEVKHLAEFVAKNML